MSSPLAVLTTGWLVNASAALALTGAALCWGVADRPLHAAGPGDGTTSPVFWMWDPTTVIGSSTLVRSQSGLTAVFHGSGLPQGQALTLWFGVINNPEHCATRPCSLADFANPAVQGDFLYGGGVVTAGSEGYQVAGHLEVNDPSGSVFIEFGNAEAAIGLLDPLHAEVLLLVHSHGPAMSGEVLKSQLSSFTGGCHSYLGPNGFAAGVGDIPDEVGECSTIQVSMPQ